VLRLALLLVKILGVAPVVAGHFHGWAAAGQQAQAGESSTCGNVRSEDKRNTYRESSTGKGFFAWQERSTSVFISCRSSPVKG
jgi:hypothetical protein